MKSIVLRLGILLVILSLLVTPVQARNFAQAETPTITSPDLANPFYTGQLRSFIIAVTNPSEVNYEAVGAAFTIDAPEGSLIDLFYFNGTGLDPVDIEYNPVSEVYEGLMGAQLPAGFDGRLPFVMGFSEAGYFPITIQLLDGSGEEPVLLDEYAGTIAVVYPPVIASPDLADPFYTGQLRSFIIAVANPVAFDYEAVEIVFTIDAPEGSLIDLLYFNGTDHEPVDIEYNPVSEVYEGLMGTQLPAGFVVGLPFVMGFSEAGQFPITIQLLDGSGEEPVLMSEYAGTITVYDPPVIASPDLAKPFIAGQMRDFTVELVNPSPVNYSSIGAVFTIDAPEGSLIDLFYFNGTGLDPVDIEYNPVSEVYEGLMGAQLPAGFVGGLPFVMGFSEAGQFPITIQLLDGSGEEPVLMSEYAGTIAVYDLPTISSPDLAKPFIAGQMRDFTVELVNPSPVNYSSIGAVFTIDAPEGSLIDLFYFNGTGLDPVDIEYNSVSEVYEGLMGAQLPAGFVGGLPFVMGFSEAGQFPITIQLLDGSGEEPVLLDEYAGTITVTAQPVFIVNLPFVSTKP